MKLLKQAVARSAKQLRSGPVLADDLLTIVIHGGRLGSAPANNAYTTSYLSRPSTLTRVDPACCALSKRKPTPAALCLTDHGAAAGLTLADPGVQLIDADGVHM
ncbi:MAG: hypothetical protein ACREX4_06325 [Gammaproteobacteria bacterium]